MWSSVIPADTDEPAPSARSKHSATLVGNHVYMLGGRNGNLPLKDFWKYDLAENKWTQIDGKGERPPCLQEHTAVLHRDCLWVFGGELGFSASTETPLWVFNIPRATWRKVQTPRGAASPKGRRGHTALVHRGSMLVYGGYQDLRGSSNELWAFHFETESWHLLYPQRPRTASGSGGSGSGDNTTPPGRHRHSAVLHDDAMWVFGGMTNLQARADLWKWDLVRRTWYPCRPRTAPGALHGHAACKLPGAMMVFGGEKDAHPSNELWRFSFTTELWEKIIVDGLKPQPRAESIAFVVSELLLQRTTAVETIVTGGTGVSSGVRLRARTSNSVDRTSRHSSYIPHNRVSPFEKMYVFQPTNNNYTDGSDESFHKTLIGNAHSQHTYRSAQPSSFLREIQKLSQLNLSKLSNNKCSYSVLNSTNNDSTESLLNQTSGRTEETNTDTPVRNKMVKSQSAHVIKKRNNCLISPMIAETSMASTIAAVSSSNRSNKNSRISTERKYCDIPREPISVPNFSTLILPTPVLTPVEATKLVYLDTDDENDDSEIFSPSGRDDVIHVQSIASPTSKEPVYENFKPLARDESYISHMGSSIYQNIPKSTSVKFHPDLDEISDENISTSDYASIEGVNTVQSIKSNPDENSKGKEGPFGFCNPNYMGPDIQDLLNGGANKAQQYAKLLNTPDSGVDESSGQSSSRQLLHMEEMVELQNLSNKNGERGDKTHQQRVKKSPPDSLALDGHRKQKGVVKSRASSASRVERQRDKVRVLPESGREVINVCSDPTVPLYVYIVGGKEQSQITVFKRPVSIWKLRLY